MRRPRVLLADDHILFMEGLRALLEPHFEIVAAVDDGRQLVRQAQVTRPDVIVADISMAELNGIEALGHLTEIFPRPKVIFLTMHSDATLVGEAFLAGASGYVVKEEASSELIKAIRAVLNGKYFVCRVVERLLSGLSISQLSRAPQRAGTLTDRQRQVLQLVAEGRSAKEIADALRISVKTAEFHKYNLMEKLGERTTAGLTRYAIRHRIVKP